MFITQGFVEDSFLLGITLFEGLRGTSPDFQGRPQRDVQIAYVAWCADTSPYLGQIEAALTDAFARGDCCSYDEFSKDDRIAAKRLRRRLLAEAKAAQKEHDWRA